ncbi:HK97 family phage major capsid protein OS=Actinotalea ferrariae CF5-4 GN=N866_07150 PE=4 SV=1: Phage_capsid [Gemmata massiliana]|uniref:Phage capsid-like C-terminal domain-containing protein n=1 Tax=Gemmata massiliana TaxID=1210884 RepID=A0A6P2D422_9BACT|nr:phage major capsid protein [Gemmata massiliana]VTR95236.1 HK97 family phage major capsid protein OS=Actinotalea ferrariae CF5-4 GN=N866_07150 PE=4 SV=1: Phage_capsid [Gemmata massiliana]
MAGKIRTRSSTPAATPAPEPIQTRNQGTNPPAAPRTVEVITAERGRVIAEAEALQTRSATQALTEAETTQLDGLLDQAEALNVELTSARRSERLAAQRSLMTNPARPAPVFTPEQRRSTANNDAADEEEAMRIWMRSFTDDPDTRSDAAYRAARGGFTVGSLSARMNCNYGGTINKDKRRALSKGGVGTGAETIPNTYSSKVTEYLPYFSPILGLVDSETTSDGNKRTYFRVDDTALESAYITASSGTELNPTIPDADIATGSVDINVFDITSGYHKLTRQVLRDSGISLTDKVTKAIGHSHARKMERDVINGTGNGTTAIQGLLQAATNHAGAGVDAFTQDVFEACYFSMPLQYRAEAIWLMSDSAMQKARAKFRDTTGRSLFGTTLIDGVEFRTLYGRPVYVSAFMPAYAANAKSVLWFNPRFYMLRLVAGQSLDVLREKFYPHLAYAGGAAFGGAWLGPTTACKFIQSDAAPDNGS